MSNETKKTALPKLRFPEFQEAEEWANKCILDLARNGLTNGVFNDPKKVGSGYKLVNVSDMYIDSFIDDEKLFLVNITPTEFLKNKVEFGDIFFTRSSLVPAGIAASNTYLGKSDDVTFDGHLIRLRPDTEITIPLFLHYLLKTGTVRSQLISKGKRATLTTIGQTDVATTTLSIPTKEEQQKIAVILSSLDELLTAQSAKLAVFQAHKRGLMQGLFPAEGETVPKLRFPEFQEAGEWVNKPLGELGSVLMCKRIFAEDTNDSVGIPFFKIGTLGGKPDAFISSELFEEYKSRYNFPRKGEVLITCSGTVGKSLQYDGEDAYYQDSNIVWIDNPTLEIKNELLFYIISNVDWSGLNSTTIKRIYGEDLRSLLVAFPEDKDEQQKVIDCLSSLDNRISAQSQKIEALKLHKKGLMQNLFPAAAEPTT